MKFLKVSVCLVALASTDAAAQNLIFAYNENGSHQIHIMDVKTNRTIVFPTAEGTVWNAAFNPDSSKIVYTLQTDNDSQVMVANRDGSNPVQLTYDQQYAYHPSFSPDGTKIAYSRLSEQQLVLMGTDGSNARVIADSPAYDSFPVFFTDGNRVLFHSTRIESDFGDPGIFVVDLTTNEVSHTGHYGTYAYPSPDGKRLVYSGKRTADADRDIFIGDIGEPSSAQALTDGGGYDGHPSFSPDGTRIVFVSRMAQPPEFPREQESDTAGTNEVFIMATDGTNLRRLTNGGAVAWHPFIKN